MKEMVTAQSLESANAERAGKGFFVMCVNSIHLVNMVPVPSQGSAPAQKAGEESFVIKI